jgi:hypothetical protein
LQIHGDTYFLCSYHACSCNLCHPTYARCDTPFMAYRLIRAIFRESL